jgi:HEAT repeat protein
VPISPVDTSFQKDMCNRHFAAFLFAASCLFGQDLQSTEPKERIKAVRALRDSGSTAIATLTPLLSDPDRDVRLETVRSIVTIGTQHSLDPLVTATRDNDPEVQIRATDGLVNFFVPGYVATGVARFSAAVRGRFDRENRDKVDPWVTVRPEVIEALGKLTRGGASMESRANAARAVGILRGKEAIPDLLEALQTKDTEVLFESLIALQKIGDTSAGPRVVSLLRDLVERVQVAAIETVGLLKTREAVSDLQRVFDSAKSAKVRRAALTSLAILADPNSRPYFDRGFEDKDDLVRAAAAEGYARLNQSSDVPKLQQAFDEEKKMPARLGAAFALVALGQTKTEEFSPLTYLVHTLNSRQYRGIAEAYLIELSKQAPVRGLIYPFIAQGTRDEKIGLARILAITGDRESIAQVEWISKDSDGEVASEGLRALKALRARVN